MTTTANRERRPRGTGSLRQRRPGVFELRIAIGVDPVTHRTRQRSITVHGSRAEAETLLAGLLTADRPAVSHPPGPLLTLAELLGAWVEADHPWKPSTLVGYRSVARFLRADALGARRAQQLLPADIRAAVQRWRDDGASDAVVAGRFRVLRAAISWAYGERLIERHPLHTMRGPSRPVPRRPLTDDQVRALLAAAESALLEAVANDTGRRAATAHRHRCELDLLLVRLAADTGARRGELAALRLGDLRGRVLHLERADSAGQLTTPKSGQGRTLTVGLGTATLWHNLTEEWADRSRRTPRPVAVQPRPRTPPTPDRDEPGTPLRPVARRRRATRGHAAPAAAQRRRPSSSHAARSCRPRPAWGTPTPPRPCGSTPTPCR